MFSVRRARYSCAMTAEFSVAVAMALSPAADDLRARSPAREFETSTAWA